MGAYTVCFANPKPWVPSLHTLVPTGEYLHNCGDRCHHFPAATWPWQLSENSLPGSASKTTFFLFFLITKHFSLSQFFFSLFKKYLSGDFHGKKSARNAGDPSSILRSGRSPGGGCGNPLQYSCLYNLMDRGAQPVIVHGIPKSRTQLSN